MFLLEQVTIDTHLEIRGLRGVMVLRDIIFAVGPTQTDLHQREPLIVEIQAERSFILAIVREHGHACTHQIE